MLACLPSVWQYDTPPSLLSHCSQNPGGDIPLIFTFFAEDDDDAPVTTPDPTDPNEPTVPIAPEVVAMFNVAEIERIIEEDVMLAAEELGLNVTVEEFLRFGKALRLFILFLCLFFLSFLTSKNSKKEQDDSAKFVGGERKLRMIQ